MPLRIAPEPLPRVSNRRPDAGDAFRAKRGTALVAGISPGAFDTAGIVQNGVVEIEQNGFRNVTIVR
jgi:hypothetical protein